MRRALAFLTPIGGAVAPSPEALRWFPAVGAAMGLALGGVWWAAHEIWNAGIAAALVVAADLALTGMLHFDGLVDAADGLLPHLSRERRLEVMAEPTVGAFGVGAAGAVLLLRWSALAAMEPSPALLGALWCASRTAMAVTASVVPYARDEGLATAFLESPFRPRRPGAPRSQRARWRPLRGGALAAAASFLVLAVGLSAFEGWWGAGAVVAALAAAAGVVAFARRRIGGFTGDVLGAAGVVGETAGMLMAAVPR